MYKFKIACPVNQYGKPRKDAYVSTWLVTSINRPCKLTYKRHIHTQVVVYNLISMGENNLVRFGGIYLCSLFLNGSMMSLNTRVRKEEVDTALRSVLDNLFHWVDVRDAKFWRVDIKWTNGAINLKLWPLVTEGGIKQRWGEREILIPKEIMKL